MLIQMGSIQRLAATESNCRPQCSAATVCVPAKQTPRRFAALGCGLLLLAISACNFLLNLNSPNGPFWDENYYLTTTARYAERRAQFASHPPLGLMLIAGGDAISRANQGVDLTALAAVKAVGATDLPVHYQIWGPRLGSALFGVVLIMTIYGLLVAAGVDVFLATITAALAAFENAFVVQFRAAQLDAIQIEFAVICVGLMAVVARRRPSLRRSLYFAGAGLAGGAAAMVKLDGVLLFVAPATLIGPTLLRRWRNARALRTAAAESLAFLTAALLIVAATYTVQTLWCDEPLEYGTAAATTDARFMSRTYQHYLDGRLAWSPAVVAAAADDSLRYMLNDQAGVGRSDPNGSPAWLQPLGVKPINFRWDSDGGMTRYVQLIANPVNSGLSVTSLLVAAALIIARPFAGRRGIRRATALSLAPLVTTAIVFYVSHGLLGAHRVMYLYHAFITDLLGILCMPFLVREMARIRRWRNGVEAGCWGVMGASIAAFLWWSPLAYHRPLAYEDCELRNIPIHVVSCRR